MRALFAVLALALVGCSASDVGDAGPSTPAPGGGVCCTPTLRTGCSPGAGYNGGWARTATECSYTGATFDGCPFTSSTDEHGCTVVLTSFSCASPCGAARDAGFDDAADAGAAADASEEAAQDAAGD